MFQQRKVSRLGAAVQIEGGHPEVVDQTGQVGVAVIPLLTGCANDTEIYT